MPEIGIGLVGCGVRLRGVVGHLLAQTQGVCIRGLCDPSDEAIRSTLDSVRTNAAVYDDYHDMLRDDRIQWIMIGSWNCLHAEQAIAALNAGKHVFCEKPLAIDFDQALQIRDAYERSQCKFFIGFPLRYTPHYQRIHKLVTQGAIGEIISFEFNETLDFNHGGFIHQDWRRHTHLAGTHLLEKCCHDIDVANWIAGSKPAKVASFGGLRFFLPENDHHATRIGPNPYDGHLAYQAWPNTKSPFTRDKDVVDHQVVILSYANGIQACFHTNCNAAIPERRCYFLGAEGSIRADLITGRIEHKRIGWDEPTIVYSSIAGGHGGGDEVMTRELGRIMQGDDEPFTTLDDGLNAAIACFAINQALDQSEVVSLDHYWQRVTGNTLSIV